MLTEQRYICEECGYVGTASEFDGHLVSKGYNYGHNDCAPDEYELQCPSCGQWEQDGISEAARCRVCDDDHEWHSVFNITKGKCKEHQFTEVCPECGEVRDVLLMVREDMCLICQLDLVIKTIKDTAEVLMSAERSKK